MADRTVRVVLTGNVTPYTNAMRAAARSTQATATSMANSMERGAARGNQAMANSAARARAESSRTASAMESMAARSNAALRSSMAGQPALASRASAGYRRVGASASSAASLSSSRWAAASARISAVTSAAAAASSRAFASMRMAGFAAGSAMLSMANNGQRSLEVVRNASLGLVAAFALAAASAARFDKSMSEVRAVTGGTAEDMKKLSDAALEAGQATVFSATQAANAEAELARAGISTADIIGGALRGALDLAASGQLELGESAIISAQAMNAFKLRGQDVGHIADVISAGAGKSATNVHDMGMAFRQAALLSSQTGLSLEDTVGSLSLFAQNALTGSDAGTSLKVMLQRLVPQSKEAAATMDAIGLHAYDAQGQFIGLTALAGQMQTAFAQLTPEARNAAMGVIFGSDAVRAATILYEAGAGGVNQWRDAVNDTGYATRVAATMTDNLAGDLERLKGSLETALIQSGSTANSVLRDMAKALNTVIGCYSQLPPSVQSNVTVMAGLVGVIGLVGAGLLLMLPRIMLVRRELVALGVTSLQLRAAFIALSRATVVLAALAAIMYAVEKLQNMIKPAPANIDKLTDSLLTLSKTGKPVGELANRFGADLDGLGAALKRINDPGGFDAFIDDMYSISHLGKEDWGALAEAKDKVKEIDEGLANLVKNGAIDEAAASFKNLALVANENNTSTEQFRSMLPGYAKALDESRMQADLAEASQKKLGDSASTTADQIADQRTEAEKLADALKALNGIAISMAEKEISFRSSLQELTDTVKKNGHSLDITTEKGRKVKSAFLDAAQAAMAHAEAVADQTGSMESGNAALDRDILLLRNQMVAAGFSTDAINLLVGAYARLPRDASTKVSAPGATNATAELKALHSRLTGLPQGKTLTIKAPTGAAIVELQALGYKVQRLPNGLVKISAPTGGATTAIAALQRRIDGLTGKTIDITTHYRTTGSPYPPSGGRANREADGGLIRGYASGGDVQWMPYGGQVFGPGTPTSDSVPTWLSRDEYVIRAASVRKYGVAMFDRLNAGRYASGGLLGGSFSYTPGSSAVLGGPSDAKERYDALIEKLRAAFSDLAKALADAKTKADALKDAEKKQAATRKDGARKVAEAEDNLNRVRRGKHTRTQLLAAEKRLADARRNAAKANDTAADKTKAAGKAKRAADSKVKQERSDVNALDRQLGLKDGAKPPSAFNLTAYQKQLTASLAATTTWRNNLAKIGRRGGQEIKDLLESMGEDGYALVNSLAGASDKQFKDIVAKLKATGSTAKATLADFTSQLGGATKESKQFAADLQKLAAQGFGDLAQALAAQGDSTAMTLAHEAAQNATAANVANKAVGQAQATLSGEDLANSLVLLSTLRSAPGKGYADLIGAGLDVAVIKKLVPRMMGQINALPEAYKGAFLRQWAGQGGVVAMARGGILTGPAAVLAAEAGDREAWIPINASRRSRALLMSTARLMGYDARPASQWAAGGSSAAPVVQSITKHYEVHLHGAKQSSAAQAADIARHLAFIG